MKVLPPETTIDEAHLSRFIQEARLASSLNHPNIAHVYDIGHEGEIAYIVMEYVEGESLGTKLRKDLLLPNRPLISARILPKRWKRPTHAVSPIATSNPATS